MKGNRKYAWILLGGLGLILIICGFFIPSANGESSFWWSHIFVFYTILGIVGVGLLMFVAKFLARFLIQRKEDYYD